MLSSRVCASRSNRGALLFALHRTEELRDLKNLFFCFSIELRQLQIPLTSLHLLALFLFLYPNLPQLGFTCWSKPPVIPLYWSFFLDFFSELLSFPLLQCVQLACEAGLESNLSVSKISKGVVAYMAQMASSET